MKNSGLIILGISILLSAAIISYAIQPSEDYSGHNVSLNSIHGFNGNENPIKLQINNVPSQDKFTITDLGKLYVVNTKGQKIVYDGKKLTAVYHRESKLLVVKYVDNENKETVRYIVDPLEWGNER